MTVVGEYQEDYYLPEYGILVVRERGAGFGEDELSATDAHPCGTIVRAGHGWLYASGGDGPCVVRLQAHADRPGDEDLDEWADVVEVPYRSSTGAVELASLSTGSGDEDLRLGERGLYRLTVAHRPLPQTIGAAAVDEDDEDEAREPTDLWQLRNYPSLAEIAAQVGLREPTSRRELLALFVALGVLTFDGSRYVGVERPPIVQDVLDLPADGVANLEAYQAQPEDQFVMVPLKRTPRAGVYAHG